MDQRKYNESLSYFEGVREADHMTPRERAEALSLGHEVDRMPIYMMSDLTTPALIGLSVKESEANARNKADVQIAGYKLFGYDGVGVMHGLYSLPVALGGKYKDPENTSRMLIEPPIRDTAKIADLDLDRVSLKTDKAARNAFDAARYIREEIGDEVECTMNFTAPFTVASGMVGIEKFLYMLVKDPERAEMLLDFVLDAQFKLAEIFLKEGIRVGTSDPVASTTIIRPQQYRKIAMQYEIRFARKCMEYTKKPLSIHICGNTTRILKDVADAGFSTFSIDNRVSLKTAKEEVGDRICIVGNVDPVAVMYQGTPEEVKDAVYQCYRDAWDSPKGFFIHSGCDMPFGTPDENIYMYLKASKACAREQAEALGNPKEKYIWDVEESIFNAAGGPSPLE